MTSWQDQQGRGGRSGSALESGRPGERLDDQPLSRRAARERERRAAEAAQPGGLPHPSGVVDFRAVDQGAEYPADQDFNVGDTSDIWAAIARRGDRVEPQRPARDELDRFSTGVPEAGDRTAAMPGASAVSGELLDRVRGAVLRPRDADPTPPSAYEPAAAATPPTVAVRRAASRAADLARADQYAPDQYGQDAYAAEQYAPAQPARSPYGTDPYGTDPYGTDPYDADRYDADPYGAQRTGGTGSYGTDLLGSGRAAETPDDGDAFARDPRRATSRAAAAEAPAAWFDAQPSVQATFGEQSYEDYGDEYYDAEYTPDPTIAIRPFADQGLAPKPATAPVDLPRAFHDPIGDDDLRFSSPQPRQPAAPHDDHRFAADPTFIEPPFPEQRAAPRAAAAPAHPAMDFVAPERHADFVNPQLGPPSEVTDLAGFEALIRQARAKAPEAPAFAKPAPKPTAWMDDEDASDGFTGLLSRQIQGSHGSSNALILPDDAPVDLTQAVSPNGDPFITGSLNLSRSLSTTGATAEHYEHVDIDRLYDASQDEPAAGVAPVRASKAVAGSGANRSFPGARRTRGNVLPTVLAIVAGAMAVGVVTLLVGSWVLKLF